MKVPVVWVLLFVVGTALLVLTFSASSSIPGMEFSQHGNGRSITGISTKLKLNGYNPTNEKKSNVDLEDYHPINPVPSSKASIKHGPIEHGSPLIPYIPKPPPPGHPKSGGSTKPSKNHFYHLKNPNYLILEPTRFLYPIQTIASTCLCMQLYVVCVWHKIND